VSEQRKRMASMSLETVRKSQTDAAGEGRVTRRDLSTHLESARTRLGISVKEIAHLWGVSHSYVSRILANVDPLPDHRLAELPDELQRAVCAAWAADLGMITGRKADLARALEALVRLVSDDAGSARVLQFPRRFRLLRMTRMTLEP
jgi:transcriptional regulator with XRE-family HTH domain